ncbi:MAG: hypothetical protein DMH00_12215 [Acidobacteria bacterium]|nr:MAG: hypothetical protein DMH00_12215 [Acidobacteriota bacterium]
MNLLRLTALLLFTYGAFSYGGMFLLWLRQYGKSGWAGRPTHPTSSSGSADLVGGAITLTSFLWFVVNILEVLTSLSPEMRQWPLDTVLLVLGFLFPPLIAHTTSTEVQCKASSPLPRLWGLVPWVLYPVSLSVLTFCLLGFYGLLSLTPRFTTSVVNTSFGVLFGFTGIYCVLVIARFGSKPRTRSETASRRWMLALFGALFLFFIPVTLAGFGWLRFTALLYLVTRSLPLAFLFVGTYFDNRFEFFDLFIKRGLSLLLTIILLTAYFALVPPRLEGVPLAWARPWVYALTLLPVAMALPWLYRRLSHWLDAVWLGRQFSTVEAVKHFLSGIQSATTQEQLVREAELRIGEIVHAPVSILLDHFPDSKTQFEAVLEIPVGRREPSAGTIRLGQRASQVPYFSQDVILLESLAEVFAYMLENVRLQRRKLEQERREQELSLHASRSELKALRAQINPHFLFNALNAIAGLIPKDPARADRAVEQLAEVFRYTLRRSESEWSRLGEELEAVRAYLDLEQARFGARLQCRVTSDPAVEEVRIPTLVVQTLVENAVKHGVAAIRGPGRIDVDALRDKDSLEIRVTDNGPGFPERAEAGRAGAAPSSGFGLRNIRERLRGLFGEEASLFIRREAEGGRTVVTLRLPLKEATSHAADEADRPEPESAKTQP